MKVYIIKQLCLGCGNCHEICSNVFNKNNQGKSIAIEDTISVKDINKVKEAEKKCPSKAIIID